MIAFNKYYNHFNVVSTFLIVASLILLVFKGLNFGIDFTLEPQQDNRGVELSQQLANENLVRVNEEQKGEYEKSAEIVSLKEFMKETNK